ncbi:hypothetical protein GGX14DRAFT_666957 [Mycena pura]|uniref:Uncharacterized protein n=1 Tax=Mycena pura TaxID=153505 RepID=A0AAD6V601_9AGAR|nr:hypothetical protein GGX14DRAFT_666957 [Mycena pura]
MLFNASSFFVLLAAAMATAAATTSPDPSDGRAITGDCAGAITTIIGDLCPNVAGKCNMDPNACPETTTSGCQCESSVKCLKLDLDANGSESDAQVLEGLRVDAGYCCQCTVFASRRIPRSQCVPLLFVLKDF